MFMVITGMLIMIIFMALFSGIYQDTIRNKKQRIFEDFAYSIQNELIIASQVQSGYKRSFDVPRQLYGFDYTISLNKSMLVIDYSDNAFALPVPNATGSFVKGINVITKQDNTILLN